MARISSALDHEGGQEVTQALHYTRMGLAQVTGRETERGTEPLELYAHIPELFEGIGAMEQATAGLSRLDRRINALAQLKAATLTSCEYCIDLGSQISRQWGLSDEELLALPFYRTSPLFNDVEKLVLDYAAGMSRTPVEVPDGLFEALRQHFDEAQLVELTHLIAVENMRGRFSLALGVGAAGFSEGMVCAVPETAAAVQ
jgi:alkylhydroperoxidase family enzyme